MLYVGAILECLGFTQYFGTKIMNFGGKLEGAGQIIILCEQLKLFCIMPTMFSPNRVWLMLGIVVLFVCSTAAFPSEGESKNDDGKYGQDRCDDGPYFEARINK